MISYHIPVAKGLENVGCVGKNILSHFGWDQSRLLKTDKCGRGLSSGEKASHPDGVTSFYRSFVPLHQFPRSKGRRIVVSIHATC